MSTTRQILQKCLVVGKKINKGGTSTIYKGTYKEEPVAIKSIWDDVFYQNEKNMFSQIANREDASQYVIKFYGYTEHLLPIPALVLELMEKDFFDYLCEQVNPLPIDLLLSFTNNLIDILEYLHNELNIIHCDIKPENFLLKNNRLKICDFGFAIPQRTKIDDFEQYTPGYVPPEFLKANKKGVSIMLIPQYDMYGFGCLMFVMTHRTNPELFKEGGETWDSTMKISHYTAKKPVKEDCPPFAKHLIDWCWKKKPEERPTASNAKEYLLQFT